jgi:hypothetical protein
MVNITHGGGGKFVMQVNGAAGTLWKCQWSEDLIRWTDAMDVVPLLLNDSGTGSVDIQPGTGGRAFYRVVSAQ